MQSKRKRTPVRHRAGMAMVRKTPLALAVAAALGTAPVTRAATGPGEESWSTNMLAATITPTTEGEFLMPDGAAMAADPDGDSLFLIEADRVEFDGSGGSNTLEEGVYYQRVNADGSLAGEILELAADDGTTIDSFEDVAVAMAADGDAVAVWSEELVAGGQRLRAQRIGPNGTRGSIVTIATGGPTDARVAMDAEGGFIIAWEDADADQDGVFYRRYAADGTALDASAQAANVTTTGIQSNVDIAIAADGDFAIAWQGPDGTGSGVFMRRFAADGGAEDVADVPVNTDTTQQEGNPQVLFDTTGDLQVYWDSEPYGGKYPGANGIFRRIYPVGASPGAVQEITPGYGLGDALMDADGDVVLAAEVYTKYGPPSVQALQVREDGTLDEAYELTGTCTPIGCEFPGAVAVDADGDLIVASQKYGYSYTGGTYSKYLALNAERFQGVEEVDLVLSIQAPDAVNAGSEVTFSATVANDHAAEAPTGIAAIDEAVGTAQGVTASFTLPEAGSLVSAGGGGWTCDDPAGGKLICAHDGALLADTQSVLDVVWQVPGEGASLVLVGTADGEVNDPKADNNTDNKGVVALPKGIETGGGGSAGWLGLLLLPFLARRRRKH